MRLHYLDAMRAVLMMLGVILHSSMTYSVRGGWEVHDTATHPIFDLYIAINGTYRMQAFFIIAGFFSQMTLQRHGVTYFLKQRLQRILVPLLTTALTLNIIQLWLIDYQMPFVEVSNRQAGLLNHFQHGDWLQHLWFLNVLLIFSIVALPVYGVLSRWRSFGSIELTRLPLWFLILAGVGCNVAGHWILHLNYAYADQVHAFGLFNPVLLLQYLPFFITGMILYCHQLALSELSTLNRTTVAMIVAVFGLQFVKGEGHLVAAAEFFREGMTFWLASHLCFVFFHRFFDRSTAFIRYFSDASYTVYLFHHLLVIFFAGIVSGMTCHAVIKFSIVCSLSFLTSLAIHEFVIRRIRLLGLLFNGKTQGKPESERPIIPGKQPRIELKDNHMRQAAIPLTAAEPHT